jgi:site-specific recombinase XerD
LLSNRQIDGWKTFRRTDLDAWLQARCQDGVSAHTIQSDLGKVRMLLRFMKARDCPIDPGLFQVKPPRNGGPSLPRYMPEPGYQRLETPILQATQADTHEARFDRAWFLTLAHTGMCLSEMLALQLDDLYLV